jgi:hypothetical protein
MQRAPSRIMLNHASILQWLASGSVAAAFSQFIVTGVIAKSGGRCNLEGHPYEGNQVCCEGLFC